MMILPMTHFQKLLFRFAYKPYNVKRIVGNLETVLRTVDIYRMRRPTYQFLRQHILWGMWPHTSTLETFQIHRSDLRILCRELIGSGWVDGEQYWYVKRDRVNLVTAENYENHRYPIAVLRDVPDICMNSVHAHYESAAQAIREIVRVTRLYQNRVVYHYEQQKSRDLLQARTILHRYDIILRSEGNYESGIYSKGPAKLILTPPPLPPLPPLGAQCRTVPTWGK